MTQNEIKRELTILGICAAVLVGLGAFAVISIPNKPKKQEFPWDYQINLHRDSAIIVTDYGDTITVHADSIQSFINQDNI